MSGKIVKLPEAVANQIAAGEVVERPVAVVKELVENALDAEAKSIEIQFERGGKSLIRVLDDGSGMSPEDALLSLQRHATSKIRAVEDILKISSFGFRGEALPSIASVSRFSLKTRTRDAAEGTEIHVDGGKEPVLTHCGMPPGTEVTVAQLFHSVPVRRKFMKTDRTEAAHILQMCRLLAVAHPEVAFSLTEDGHEVFRTPTCPDRLQRVREIFGRRRAEDLLPVDIEADGFRIHGLVGRPSSGRNTRAELITYVNHRPVDSRLLSYALIESYHRFLPRGRYPVAFLFVDVPPDSVDVNVHPTKREVRFRNEPAIRNLVMSRLTELLDSQSRQTLQKASPVTPVAVAPPAIRTSRPPVVSGSPAVPVERRAFPEIAEKPYPVTPGPSVKPAPASLIWEFIGIFKKRIGLFESPDGLVLLNARAARERILMERIEGSLQGTENPRQSLLIPPLMELSPLDASVLGDQLTFFDSLGFEIEPFGRNLYRLRSAPAWLEDTDAEAFIEDLVNRIRERGLRVENAESARTLIARLAATRESRAYLPTGEPEWKALAKELLDCENPLLDARGRPTFVEMRHGEITRKLMLDAAAGELDDLDGIR